uniref:N(6)-L-threonylcarbamoyladenine synthase n=1 Tax=Timema genevievae TaxID=629358 RepID=A0A7R9PK32_TIMGE|nr:unnamed protein product [Timema genevievae]
MKQVVCILKLLFFPKMIPALLYRIVRSCYIKRNMCTPVNHKSVILGLETSCDDTGCAIVDSCGNILGEALHSQLQVHLNNGGIIPPIARDLHKQHIERVVEEALASANLGLGDVDAIATTVKPGMALSLLVGMNHGKHLAKTWGKPFIPIHHMEAHALTIRMVTQVEFPFLVLLISGGHCLLAVAQGVHQFLLLGQSLDDAPGEAFDKTARRMKLHSLPEFRGLSGGAAIQLAATRGDPLSFQFPFMLSGYRDCNFSMAGLKNKARQHILRQEHEHGVEGDGIIPGVYDLCASVQWGITSHLCQRLQRAMEFISMRDMLPLDRRTLVRHCRHKVGTSTGESLSKVVSGGVACNSFITGALGVVCEEYGYSLAVPPPKLCTDNGVMIAWNGVEKWRSGVGVVPDLDAIDIEPECPLGVDRREDVVNANIKCKWIKPRALLRIG